MPIVVTAMGYQLDRSRIGLQHRGANTVPVRSPAERFRMVGKRVLISACKIERKIGHLTRRLQGGRRARCRGTARVLTGFITRAAAINLQRLATLGLHHDTTWTIATT